MKTIGIIIGWFVFIGVLASFVSCSSTVHCDAYGQAKQVTTENTASK